MLFKSGLGKVLFIQLSCPKISKKNECECIFHNHLPYLYPLNSHCPPYPLNSHCPAYPLDSHCPPYPLDCHCPPLPTGLSMPRLPTGLSLTQTFFFRIGHVSFQGEITLWPTQALNLFAASAFCVAGVVGELNKV